MAEKAATNVEKEGTIQVKTKKLTIKTLQRHCVKALSGRQKSMG
jgi:hypothetical protein